jgi:hypothetical protein
MFEPSSRYANIENANLLINGGKNAIAYKKRRFLPDGEGLPLLREITITVGDRLDLIAARILGDPEQFWYVCDANNAMHPLDLTVEPNRILKIARPWR